jgi:uncharacterized protein (DUF3084 family)
LIEHHENVALEAALAEQKSALKALKSEIDNLVSDLDRQARSLADRYEAVQLRSTQLEDLPPQIDSLESTIAELRAAQEPASLNPVLAMPLPETLAALEERNVECAKLDAQIAALEAAIPAKNRELERLERELVPLEIQKEGVVAQAKEARRRREAGEAGMGDDIENQGRWLRAMERGISHMVEG